MWRLAPVLVSVAPACLVNTAKNDQDRLYSLLVLPNKIDQIVLMIELLRAGQGRVLHDPVGIACNIMHAPPPCC